MATAKKPVIKRHASPSTSEVEISSTYKQHPLGKVFPSFGMSDLAELSKDIAANGLVNPITMFEGKILDGWNRYNACKRSGTLPRMVEFKGDDPAMFVISQNINRRHLSTNQRVTLAKKLLVEESKRAAVRQKTLAGTRKTLPPVGGKVEKGTAAAKVAKAVGVSARSVERATAIDKKAVKEVRKAVESGDISLREGERIAKLPKAKQAREVKSPKAIPDNYDLDSLKRVWARSTRETQAEFLTWISTIDDEPAIETKIVSATSDDMDPMDAIMELLIKLAEACKSEDAGDVAGQIVDVEIGEATDDANRIKRWLKEFVNVLRARIEELPRYMRPALEGPTPITRAPI